MNILNTLILKQTLWKMETFFKKTEVPFFYLKVLRLKMLHLHTKLLCQKQMLRQIECGVQNRMWSTKDSSITTFYFYFIFLKNLFHIRSHLQKTDLMYELPKYPCSYFLQVLEFYLRMLVFTVGILNK